MPEPITPVIPASQPETVSKADFDRVQTTLREKEQGLEALRGQLLDPKYLEFIAAKNTPAAPQPGTQNVPIGQMSLADLTALIDRATSNAIAPRFAQLENVISNVDAKIELREVMERHADFETFRPKVVEILNGSRNELSIEQAYLIAKASTPVTPATPPTPAAPAAPRAGTPEKPGGVLPVAGDTLPKFADAKAAGQAAWATVAAKHGVSGDTI